MKILVTGATGFIGYALISELERRHLDVMALARRSSRVEEIRDMGIPVEFADITDAQRVMSVFEKARPGMVVHLAARVMNASAEEFYRINAQGTENVCRAAKAVGAKRLVHVSSVAAIGGAAERPLSDDMPLKPAGPYGESKAEAERIVNAWREKGLRSAIVRPCIVYGEREPHALGNLLRKARFRTLPLLEGDLAERKLQLGYVDNIVDVIVLCMKKAEALQGSFIAADREALNYRAFLEILYSEFLNGRPPVVPEVFAKLLCRTPVVGAKVESVFKERTYDISRSVELLGWDGGIPPTEALRKTIAFWKSKK